MTRPGKLNLITDVAGLKVGQAEDFDVRTGVTVILADKASLAAVDVRGGAPGTRETESLDPVNLGGMVDAITLAGGSVYGLDAASGVMAWLGARGRGFHLVAGAPPAPIVPGAIIFDLANGGDKSWGETPPYRVLGIAAVQHAGERFALGNAGAGLGARAGVYKGGTGSASAITDDGFTVGALAIVNAVGSPIIPHTDVFWAFPFEQAAEFGGRRLQGDAAIDLDLPDDMKRPPRAGTNTTIAVVATDAALSCTELKRMAIMAADGFARALRPVHAPFDGDTVFALSTAKKPIGEPRGFDVMRMGSLAADCLARAIARGVFEADSTGGVQSYRDMFSKGEKRS
ncbi:MAG: P1 family peptidase [Rhizomicrobium sp.]|jgi:L-aminopeptidase/D-esterase-like protein